eukprot:g39627.t1
MPESRRALWQKKSEHGSSLVVHVRDMGTENVNQDKEFSGRTSLPADWFEKKDLSLTLTQVSMSDAGDYECHVVTQRPHASNVCMDFKLTVTSDLVMYNLKQEPPSKKSCAPELILECSRKFT